MADLYSILAGIQPDQQDVIEAELLAKQILEAQFPDLDLREGTAVRDLVLRPSAFLLALCKKSVDFHFAQNTIAGITDESPSDLVDGILGNLFLTRNTGTQAVVNARLFFARQKVITLTTSNSFSPNNTQLFFPAVTATYPASALQLDAFSDEWYLDVDLVAADKGIEYNISSGSLLYFNSPDPFFLRGEINFLAEASTDPETNSQFISRAQSSISTRNLINKPSIDNKLRQDFNVVHRVSVIGAGDPEAYRDQVEAKGAIGTSRNGSSWVFTDGGTKVLVSLPAHGFVTGSQVNAVESGSGVGLLQLYRQPITDILDANTFKVGVPFSFPVRALAFPIITPTEEDVFVHQGGCVDIHVGDEIDSEIVQFTLDNAGKTTITGPYFSVVRYFETGGDSPDTVPDATSFVLSYPGHALRTGISLSQAVNGDLTLTMPRHPLAVGRIVRISGWPSPLSSMYLPVREVTGEDTVLLGRNLPVFSVSSGLSPSVTYVYPSKDVGFSTRQELVVDFGLSHADQLVSFELGKFKNLDSIQAYLDLSSNRVVCADYLARGFDLYILDFNIEVYDTSAPSSAEVADITSKFLAELAPGQEFLLSDLVARITASGISKLKTPLSVNYSFFNKDFSPVTTGVITDALHPATPTSVFVVGSVTTGTQETP